VAVAAVSLWGCGAGIAFRRGEEAIRRSDPDAAVVHYREALQADPDRPEFKIALERAMLQASQVHFAAAKAAEEKGDLDVAVREYRRASEYDPTNRQVAAKVVELDQIIRDRIESSRPKPAVQQMRERARGQEPVLNPASKEPLDIRFTNASVRDILNFVGSTTGINVAFSSDYRDPPAYTVQLAGVTLEESLQQVLSANNLFYKILNSRTIMVIPDNAQNRAKHEEQVVRTFFLSHADATEVAQLLNTVLRVPGVAVIPTIAPNKTRNTITVRGTAAMVSIMERVVEANDRPSAEVLLDVSIMEVNRTRAKQYGIDLGAYSISGIFSPEVAPTVGSGGGISVPPFNANTISAGISAADFYLTLPTAIARFLESDTRTKLVAKPQLRGQEGQKITLNLGDEIPVPQTTFGSLGGAGSVGTVPVSSFNYKNVGVNVIMTPRVTFDGDIVLELSVESSTLGADIDIAGQNLPSFGSRKIETKIRLRDGESTLLAGLLREDERRFRRGPLGLMNLPVFRSLFSHNDTSLGQTDIVMLITPHVVRTHELRQQDVNPIHIGTQQHLGLGGPPPLIAPQPAGAAEPQPPGPLASPRPTQQAPPRPITGTSQPGPVPGTMPAPGVVPQLPPPQAPTTPPPPEPAPPLPDQAPVPQAQAGQPGTQAPAAQPAPQGDAGAGRVIVTPPGTELSLTGGPYTVPVSLSNVPRVSAVSVSVVFDPSLVRVRSVQEGSFMRQGGVTATFTREIDNNVGRVDISFARGQDPVGASGTGLLAALQVEPLAAGTVTFTVSGAGSGPAGSAVTLGSTPVTVTVR
jgi:type II secretory pathway component GspD/PulD (secretin)